MKKILILSIVAIAFMACGGESSNGTTMVEDKKFLSCSDIYTEKYIKSKFLDVEKIKSYPQHGTCGYAIKCKSETYNTFYTVQQNANESMLTQSLSYFNGVKPFEELGKDAYIYEVGGIKQITLLDNGNLISANVWRDSNSQFDMKRTKELILDMNEKLK